MRLLKKESSIVVQRYSGTWLDIGTWNTLAEVMPEHTIGRVTPDENCMNVYAVNTLPMPILCKVLKDVVVAASPVGILSADKECSSTMRSYSEHFHTPVMYTKEYWGELCIIDAETKRLTLKITLTLSVH